MKALLIVLALGKAALACPEVVDAPRARDVYEQGEQAYAAGRYDDALRDFTSALEHSGRAELYFNLANTLERMGDRARAADALDQYLECAAPPDADLVRERARRLRDDVALPPLTQPICTERAQPPEPILVLTADEPRDDAGVERPRPRAAPWFIAGGASLVLAAGLAYASTTAAADPACDDCRLAPTRDWTPVLQGGAVLAATAALVTTTIALVTVIRF